MKQTFTYKYVRHIFLKNMSLQTFTNRNTMPKNTDYFNKLCKKHFTKEENELLTYEQKVELLNFDKKVQLSDNRYNKLTKNKPVDMGSCDYTGIGETLDSLPMTDRQRRIACYRYQRYTIEEIADLINISQATINRELIVIKEVIGNNKELLEPEHETWNKKVTDYNE